MSKRANSEGSIYRHKTKGLWVAQLTAERRRLTSYHKTQAAARTWLAEQRRQADLGLLPPRQTEVLSAYMKRWLEAVAPSLRPKTVACYEQVIRLHLTPDLGQYKLTQLRPDHVQAFYARKLAAGSSPRLVQLCHAVLHRALAQALKWGLVPRNVTDAVTAPRPRQRHRVQAWTIEEAQAFLEHLRADGVRLEALYALAIATGLRQGELLGLYWDDVDLERGRAAVRRQLQRLKTGLVESEPKTAKSRRTVTFPPVVVEALRRWRVRQLEERLSAGQRWAATPYVFTSSVGTPLEPRNVTRDFQALLVRLKLSRVRFHDLRHTCATLLLTAGQHPKLVQELLGHSQITLTLDTYSHAVPTLHDQVAGAMEQLLTRPPRPAAAEER